ncbi:MAG: YciI family protein [Flavobacteriales bacterium]|nr:YciI family protein [Flavobacteriales bacterium]
MRFLWILFVLAIYSCSDQNLDVAEESKPSKLEFDSALAASLGADDYGMKKYVMAFLKRGPNRDHTEEEVLKLQRAHLDNIHRLAEAGKLVIAGPFLKDGDLRGIYVFNVETVEEAQRLTETDPSIKEGRLVMELIPWYGSASLLQINDLHKTIAKKKV